MIRGKKYAVMNADVMWESSVGLPMSAIVCCAQGGSHDGVSLLNQKSCLDNVSRRNCNER